MVTNRARWWIGASVGLLTVMLMPGLATAQQAPSITVTPSTGLVDGQTVTVEGTGFAPTTTFGSLTVGLCPADILIDVTQAPFRCSATAAFPVPVDGSGTFVAQLQVFRSQPTFAGGNTLTCAAAPANCVVLALEVAGASSSPELIVATAPISFRAETIQDCQKGGWRSFSDGEGRPFRNQGGCVSFVRTSGSS
jgi:hypothetical protein